MLKGKNILLCVTGGIAAYKSAMLASALIKQHARVYVLMTQNAANFIAPMTFEALTGNNCVIDTFDRKFVRDINHISLAEKSDLAIVAPASANVIAKLAHGLADDMLTTTLLACKCPKLIAPAMNTNMYENPITQDNLATLSRYGFTVVPAAEGRLACGSVGAGKMPEPDVLLDWILQETAFPKDWNGQRVLITAGPTQEAVDPVRFLTNHSSGKMGYALAEAAARRGAGVTLVRGPVNLEAPRFVTTIPVISAREMFEAVQQHASEQDVIIKAAAVADFTPVNVSSQKIKKSSDHQNGMSLALQRTTDILQYLGEHKAPGQFLCGFAMETEHLLENARRKLEQKHLDLICANSLSTTGAGFQGDTNVITMISSSGQEELPLLSKQAAAHLILDKIQRMRREIR